jgi:hypothetical protein
MNRIYHRWELWEDYRAGFYDNISGKNKELLSSKVIELFSSKELTEEYMNRVIKEWPYSCEHNLTNTSMNRIAYLSQAACCLFAGCTSSIVMEGWHLVSKENRDISDNIAKEIINEWEKQQQNKQICLKLD